MKARTLLLMASLPAVWLCVTPGSESSANVDPANRWQTRAPGSPQSSPTLEVPSLRSASRFITIDGTRLHYLVQGAGRAVVLIHGNPGSAQDWLSVFPSLSARHRVIAFDRPGHGLSQRPKHGAATLEIQARLIHDALAQLRIERPIIVGHSWAAALALVYAIRYPKETAGIVVVAPAVYESHDDESFLTGLPAVPVIGAAANYVLTPLVGSSLVQSELKKAFSPDPVPKSYQKTAVKEWTKPARARAYALDDSTFNSSLRKFSPRYAEITIPVSILAGDSDLIVSGAENAGRLHEAMPKSRLVVLPRTGHEIPITKPRSVVDEIERVDRLARPRLRW